MRNLLSPATIKVLVGSSYAALMLSGCFAYSKPSKFYRLSAVVAADDSIATEQSGSVQIVALNFPDYLSNPQMVVSLSAEEVKIEDYDRWAESLKSNFERVLVENLMTLRNSANVYGTAERVKNSDRLLTVDIFSFDIDDHGAGMLKARWRVTSPSGQVVASPRISKIAIQANSSQRADQAKALSEALGALSREISATL